MKENIQIAVPRPCHQKWDSFTRTFSGGFCNCCQKEVVDFTSWSEDRLKLYFKNLPANTCGRFRPDQLKVYSYDNSKNTGISWISFLFSGFLFLFSSRHVSAQTTPKQITEQVSTLIPLNSGLYGLNRSDSANLKGVIKSKPETVTIIGIVTSRENGKAMPGVKVVLKGTSTETLTNDEGKFALDLLNKDSSQFIVFSLKGFKTVEYLHNVTRPGREIAVDLTRNQVENIQDLMGGTVGGVVLSRWYSPKEIARDVWCFLTG